MAKVKKFAYYKQQLYDRCVRQFGEDYALDNEELIETAARNKRLLDRFDNELDGHELTVVSTGSQGQMKEDINPIVKHRNDVAKLYADNLDALFLTPRARFKKTENGGSKTEDPLADFLKSVK